MAWYMVVSSRIASSLVGVEGWSLETDWPRAYDAELAQRNTLT